MTIFTKKGETLLHEEESYKLRGLWMKIYNTLGPGHKEITYGNAFEELLKREGVLYEREPTLVLSLDGKKVGTYRPDFIVHGKIIVEFKSLNFIPRVFSKKIYQYLRSSDYKLGFIVNFGAPELEIIRRVYDSKRHQSSSVESACNPQYPRRAESACNPSYPRGFTLIELILYLAIISTVAVSFVYYSISITNTRAKTYVVQEVHANARTVLNLTSQRIMASNGVDGGASTFGVHPGVLSLDFSVVDPVKDRTVINVNGAVVQIKEGLAAAIPITSNEVSVTNFKLTNLTSTGARENIRLELTVAYNNPSGDVHYNYSKSFQTTVSVRQ